MDVATFLGWHWAANKKLKISCEGPYVVNAFTRWLPLLRLSSVTHSLSFLIPPPAPLSCTLFSIETFTYFSHPYLALCCLWKKIYFSIPIHLCLALFSLKIFTCISSFPSTSVLHSVFCETFYLFHPIHLCLALCMCFLWNILLISPHPPLLPCTLHVYSMKHFTYFTHLPLSCTLFSLKKNNIIWGKGSQHSFLN